MAVTTQVNRLDDTSLAIRPDLKPYYETKKAVRDEQGGVGRGRRARALSVEASQKLDIPVTTKNILKPPKYSDGFREPPYTFDIKRI